MTKKELLKECISIAYDIGDYGSYVFVNVMPHVNKVDFRVYLNGWSETLLPDLTVGINRDLDYADYGSSLKENKGVDTVESLHKYLTNFYNDQKVYHETGK